MAERIRLQLTLRNPLLLENNRRYPFAVELTLEAVDVIEQTLQIEIDHNEFGYLVLYFNLAWNRYQSRIKTADTGKRLWQAGNDHDLKHPKRKLQRLD